MAMAHAKGQRYFNPKTKRAESVVPDAEADDGGYKNPRQAYKRLGLDQIRISEGAANVTGKSINCAMRMLAHFVNLHMQHRRFKRVRVRDMRRCISMARQFQYTF